VGTGTAPAALDRHVTISYVDAPDCPIGWVGIRNDAE
jgi:hypothetical protein